jgi:hypothetical protein
MSVKPAIAASIFARCWSTGLGVSFPRLHRKVFLAQFDGDACLCAQKLSCQSKGRIVPKLSVPLYSTSQVL